MEKVPSEANVGEVFKGNGNGAATGSGRTSVALELGCMRALGMLNACRRDGLAAHSKTKSGNASLTQIILEDAVCSPIKP